MSRTDRAGLALVLMALLGGAAWMASRLLVDGGARSDAPEQVTPAEEPPQASLPGAQAETSPSQEPPPESAPRGSRWSELNVSAIAALEAGDLERAVELFEQCHAGSPDERVFAANLAEALARLARRDYAADAELGPAIERLERALLLDAGREDLAAQLERWRKLATTEEGFWTDETAHFRLSYDGARSELLERGYGILTQALEQAYGEFAVIFQHDPAPVGAPKIKVVLYAREEFSDLTGIGHWAGGVYDGVVRVPVVDFERERETLVRVLRHELVHAFLRGAGASRVPAWLNEGLAQWHEKESPLARQAAVTRARARLSGGELFPLGELKQSFTTWTDTEDISRGYAESLALVAYIETWYGERVLYEMVEGCAQGTGCAETFEARLGVNLEDVVRDLGEGL